MKKQTFCFLLSVDKFSRWQLPKREEKRNLQLKFPKVRRHVMAFQTPLQELSVVALLAALLFLVNL
jgi:hypothetical protein